MQGSSSRSRIRHTSQGDGAEYNAAGGILMMNQGIYFLLHNQHNQRTLLPMARRKRIVAPGYPHHIVQRGVRSLDIFFNDQDRFAYFDFLNEQSIKFGLTILAYCLMTNHVHLLVVPEKADSLAKAIGETHRQYTRMINSREGVRGFLFQGRFSSCPVYSDQYLFTALRYIEQNPVKASMVTYPWQYEWSSAAYHCGEVSHDPLVSKSPFFSDITDWKAFLSSTDHHEPGLEEKIRTGRPFGPDSFYSIIEDITGRDPRPRLPGRPKKNNRVSPNTGIHAGRKAK